MELEYQNTRQSESRILAGYQIGRTIGKGTFGKVKLGIHLLTGQHVAVKILEKQKICNEADRRRVDREIQILRKIRHPNIIQLYEIIETHKYMFLITEYAEGGELFDYIVNRNRLSEIEAGRFLQQIINAVEYIHKLGIVHRDLKPENLLLDRNNNIKVVDFGLSNIYAKGEQLKTACGSPCYAAPEMVTGQAYFGVKTDIWSCGIILYAMCCGYLPFDDPNTSDLYRKIADGNYTLPSFASETFASLLKRVLSVEPENRASFEQIRRHPFCSFLPQPVVDGIVVGVSCIPVELQIVHKISSIQNVPVSKVEQSILLNKHNPCSSAYYLVLQKTLRDNNSNLLSYFIGKQAFIHKYNSLQKVKDIVIKNMLNRKLRQDSSVERGRNRTVKSLEREYRNTRQSSSQKKNDRDTSPKKSKVSQQQPTYRRQRLFSGTQTKKVSPKKRLLHR